MALSFAGVLFLVYNSVHTGGEMTPAVALDSANSPFFYGIKFGYQNGIHYICKKDVIMTVVSVRDFRANQSKYLGLAAGGESVILTSRTGSFKIVPITEDDSLISKKEFFARIDEARKSIAEGKGTSVSGKEELDSLLAKL